MSFAVYADGTANLPAELRQGMIILPCEYTINGKPEVYEGDLENFDTHSFYEALKNGQAVKTSLLNTELFLTRFRETMEQGQDAIYVSMSSGISGTYSAACAAAV